MDTMQRTGSADPGLVGARVLIVLSQILIAGDVAFMTIALTGLGTQTHATPATLQWILSAMLLTCGGFLILGGRLADLVGIRRMYLLGAVLFTVGMLPGLFSTSLIVIIAGRVVSGLGSAFLGPSAVALIVDRFEAGTPRDRAFSLFTIGQSVGFFGGTILGGLAVGTLGWRGMFAFDVVLGLANILIGLAALPHRRGAASLRGLDVPGAVTVTLGVGLLVYAMSSIGEYGFVDPHVLLGFVGAALMLLVFVLIERRTVQPLVDFSIFSHVNMTISVVIELVVNAFGLATFVPALLYVQHVAHLAPTSLGLMFIPALVVSLIVARIVPHLLRRFAGRTVASAAFIPYLFLLFPVLGHDVAIRNPHAAFVFAMICICSSITASTAAIITIFAEVTGGASPEQRGVISAVMLATGQIGAPLGLAIIASTLVVHTTAGGENFSLTFLSVVVLGSIFGLITLASFRRRPPMAVVGGHH